MTGADGDTGEADIICDAVTLAKLLDRSELQPGDEAYCADELLGEVKPCCICHLSSTTAPTCCRSQPILHSRACWPSACSMEACCCVIDMVAANQHAVLQVGQGKVQELAAQAGTAAGLAAASQGADDGAAESRHAAEEARMLQLLAERAAILEQAKVRQPLQ